MFDIGFLELVLISVVALLVLGPERLPGAIKTLSVWVGRFRRSFQQIKAEVEREINADEIRQQLHNETIMADLRKAQQDLDQLGNDIKNSTDLNRLESPPAGESSTAAAPDKNRQATDPNEQ